MNEIEEQIERLQEQLQQRGNILSQQDPLANRIMGKIEALREQVSPVTVEEEVVE